MSVVKLMSRVVECMGNSTGITFDATTQLASVFTALIHDVDHLGVPNSRLAEEKPEFAAKYDNRSIAENHSITLAWNLFMQPEFKDFRTCIAPNDDALEKFRETVNNATLATDIVDKDLKADRNARWEHAFSENVGAKADELKSRIVLEHLIQASDVAHTMQLE